MNKFLNELIAANFHRTTLVFHRTTIEQMQSAYFAVRADYVLPTFMQYLVILQTFLLVKVPNGATTTGV